VIGRRGVGRVLAVGGEHRGGLAAHAASARSKKPASSIFWWAGIEELEQAHCVARRADEHRHPAALPARTDPAAARATRSRRAGLEREQHAELADAQRARELRREDLLTGASRSARESPARARRR